MVVRQREGVTLSCSRRGAQGAERGGTLDAGAASMLEVCGLEMAWQRAGAGHHYSVARNNNYSSC